MSDRIPHELIEQIFSRLPVKTLVRFKCISKSWRDIIGSPDFIQKHLTHFSSHSLILGNCNIDLHEGTEESYLYSADYDSFLETDSAVFKELSLPLNSRTEISSEILGSCNGLLCLLRYRYLVDQVILWNPSTRKHRILPVAEVEVPTTLRGCSQTIYGFALDFVNDDYKVVSMLQIDGHHEVYSVVKVYSLKLKCWKRIQDFPYYFNLRYGGKLANGALHWVVKASRESDREDLIAAFDIGTEEYRLMPQPEYSNHDFDMRLGVLADCLCVLCDYFMDDCVVHFDMWVMKEYGVKESWNKLISIKRCDLSEDCHPVLRPIGYSKCGRRVLLGQANQLLLWYDLESKSVSYPVMKVPCADEFFELGIFLESLAEP